MTFKYCSKKIDQRNSSQNVSPKMVQKNCSKKLSQKIVPKHCSKKLSQKCFSKNCPKKVPKNCPKQTVPTLVTQPMLQLRLNQTELRSMDLLNQILCRFQKFKRKVPPPQKSFFLNLPWGTKGKNLKNQLF